MLETYPEKPKISEVISIVAHQLKNPLSVIKGYLEVLLSGDFGKVNQKQEEYLSDALENVKIMRKIVGYLLDVSRIEEKKYIIKTKPVALGDLIQEVINDFSSLAKASNCEIFFKKPKDFPSVSADPLRIRQVIENLISNALKYRSVGGGKLEIRLSKKNKEVVVSFKDNGIGIPKEEFKKVFSKFYRSESAVELDPSGTGLGLYISKAIIKLHGGKIWFKINKDFGTTFYFTIPIAKI